MLVADKTSNNCLEGCRFPATDSLITFQSLNSYRLEGTEMVLVEHHTKYKEIHGIDETVWMTWSEHKKLHLRLRREGKCKIPVKELAVISTKANQRTLKYKNLQCRIHRNRMHENRMHFTENIAPYVTLFIDIFYYPNTDSISITSYFQGGKGKKLKIIKETN